MIEIGLELNYLAPARDDERRDGRLKGVVQGLERKGRDEVEMSKSRLEIEDWRLSRPIDDR